jgi:uncharacterized protein
MKYQAITKDNPTPAGIEMSIVNETVGMAIRTTVAHERGTVIEHFTGTVSPHTVQHSLQVSPFQHILDLNFVGYLMHSCDPNCVLDMQRLRVLALKNIEAGALLTIDYAVTEDELYRQFPCQCGAPNCRQWITGRSQPVNAEGRRYLARPLAA